MNLAGTILTNGHDTRCNPFPTLVEWQVDCRTGEDDFGCKSLQLLPGHAESRFNTSEVEVEVRNVIMRFLDLNWLSE